MSIPAAVVLDVDGTLVDSEQDGHRVAFNTAFERAGLPHRWDRATYRGLLRVPGGRARIRHYLVSTGVPAAEADAAAVTLHRDKTRHFLELVATGGIPLRPGAARFVDDLRSAGLPLYVATAGNRIWVEPVLRGHFGDDAFALMITGSEIPELKPAPDVYRAVLERTGLAAGDAVAVEDSLNGLRAAHGAGLPCLVVLNDESEGDFSGAELVVTGYGPGAEYVSGPAGPDAVSDGQIGVATVTAVAQVAASRSSGGPSPDAS